MAYINQFLEGCFGYGFEGGPQFNTQIVELQNGREKRNATWAQQKHKYTGSFNNISNDDYKLIKRMHFVARGRLHAFKIVDPLDNFADNEIFGQGNGVKTEYQLITTSEYDDYFYTRGIYGVIVDDEFEVRINGVIATGYTVDTERGKIAFDVAPVLLAELTWTGNFFVWVRFDDDHLPFTLDNPNATNGVINLIEVAPPPESED